MYRVLYVLTVCVPLVACSVGYVVDSSDVENDGSDTQDLRSGWTGPLFFTRCVQFKFHYISPLRTCSPCKLSLHWFPGKLNLKCSPLFRSCRWLQENGRPGPSAGDHGDVHPRVHGIPERCVSDLEWRKLQRPVGISRRGRDGFWRQRHQYHSRVPPQTQTSQTQSSQTKTCADSAYFSDMGSCSMCPVSCGATDIWVLFHGCRHWSLQDLSRELTFVCMTVTKSKFHNQRK